MKLTWKHCFMVSASIFLLYLAVNYWQSAASLVSAILGAALPLIIGGIIAYLVNILMANYERKYFPNTKSKFLIKSRRPVCMLLAFFTLIAIVVLVCLLIIPQLVDCVSVIIAELPGFMNEVIALAAELELFTPEILQALNAIDWKSQIGNLVNVLTSGLGSVVDVVIAAVSSVFSGVVTALISTIFAIYILSTKERLGNQAHRILKRYLREKTHDRILYFLHILDDCFHRYIVGQCTEAVILGMLCAIGMGLLGLPYGAMIGALIAFTALIPIAGAYIGAGVGAFMILTADPWGAVVFLIFIVVLQQLEGNLIYPRVVGSSMGLPGIWVLAAVTVGGGIMGIGGMLLGVPLAAAIYRVIRDDVQKHERLEAREDTESEEVTEEQAES